MKRFAIFIVTAMASIGCHHEHKETEEEGKYVVTTPLRKDTSLTKDYVGQIRAIQHIELRALEKGYLQSVYVDEGQQIKAGQAMFQIMSPCFIAIPLSWVSRRTLRCTLTNAERRSSHSAVSLIRSGCCRSCSCSAGSSAR